MYSTDRRNVQDTHEWVTLSSQKMRAINNEYKNNQQPTTNQTVYIFVNSQSENRQKMKLVDKIINEL